MKRPPSIGIVAGALVLVLALVAGVVYLRRDQGTSVAAGGRHNVVVILTDDQTLEEMRVMDTTRKVLGDEGTTFSHYYASFPNCCPSRATYYTGQYAHNDGVRDNLPPYGGFHTLRTAETINVALQDAGYYTAQIGKFLNQWGADGNITPPPGWSHWFGLIDPSTYHYFDYSVSDDGKKKDYGHADADYSTDVLGAEAVRTIGDAAHSGKPFYLSFTPLSPHVENAEKSDLKFEGYQWPMAKPAPRHAGSFAGVQLPKTPSYNEIDVSAKPDFVREMHPITKTVESLATKSYQLELETLKSTDEWVGKIVQSLKDNGVYDNTVIMFTSDNGLFHGEHRIANGKLYLYEPAVHLPLIIAGPGIPKGEVASQTVSNVDLGATILAATQVSPKVPLDGRNVVPLAVDPELGKGRAVLLENTHGGAVLTEGLHTERFVYLENKDGTKELYDLAADPDEMQNLTGSPKYHDTETNLAARLAVAHTCAGATCEGSDASNNAVPAGAAAPEPDPNTIASDTIPPSAEQLSAFDTEARVTQAQEVMVGLFELGPKEKACTEKALTEHADLLDSQGKPILQSNRALVNAIGVSKACINAQRFAAGLGAFLPILTEGRLASDAAVCVGRAMNKLDDAALARVFEYLLNPNDDPDVEAKARTGTILTGCKVAPASVVP
jgi:arylsulfatase A-like enzyme